MLQNEQHTFKTYHFRLGGFQLNVEKLFNKKTTEAHVFLLELGDLLLFSVHSAVCRGCCTWCVIGLNCVNKFS